MNLPIIKAPHPILSHRADVVTEWKGIPSLVEEMLQSMYDHQGIGLAAPQVGQSLRVVVIDLKKSKYPYILVNPVVIRKSGVQKSSEGCLSIPGIHCQVERSANVLVTAQDAQGRPWRCRAQGLLAACIEHEIDHLEGILMSDKNRL